MSDSVLGLDLSLRSTGLARVRSTGACYTWIIGSRGKRADTLVMRADRIADLAGLITAGVMFSDRLVVLEAPSYGQLGGSTWDRAGLWWAVVLKLSRINMPVAMVAPTTVKKWATGSGKAAKGDVQKAMAGLYPGAHLKTSDEADALAMAHLGAFYRGFEPPILEHHTRKTMAAVKWPEGADS